MARFEFDPDDIEALVDALLDPLAAGLLKRFSEVQSTPSAAPSSWLTTREAAAYLGLGKSTLEIWRMEGKGPQFTKAGGRVRYNRAELDAWQRGGK